MFIVGTILFLISSVIIFGSDKMYKKGKITNLKKLLIIKVAGLALAVTGVFFMIYGK